MRSWTSLFVSYGSLSGTMYVCVLWSSLQHYVCVLRFTGMYPRSSLFVSHGALPNTMFVSYGALSGTFFYCGVTSGALSGTNASTTGLQNLMETTLGHEQSQPRGAKQSSYPPFNLYWAKIPPFQLRVKIPEK